MKSIIRNNFLLYKSYFKYEPAYCIMRLFTGILVIVQPISSIYLFQLFMDAIFVENDIKKSIIIAAVTAAVNFRAAAVNWMMNNKLTPISEQKNSMRYICEILNIYLRTDIDIIEDPNFYDKYTQVINDISNRVMAVQNAICSFVGNLCSLGIIITLMIRIGPMMVLVSLIGVVTNLVMTPIMNKIGFAFYQDRTPLNRKQDYIKRIFYIRDYSKELKLYNISNLLLKKVNENNTELISITRKYGNKFISCGLIVSLFQCLSFAAVLLYLAYCAIFGSWTIGYVASMFNASNEMKDVMGKIFETLPLFDENNRYIENYQSLVNNKNSKIENINSSEEKYTGFESIVISNLDFTYKNSSKKALDGVNMSFEKGGKYALVGHNGAGKSTLINLLLRLYDPTNGEILLDGKRYNTLDVHSLRSLFNVVLQNCQVYALSIAENILMHSVKNEEDEQKVWNALGNVGLDEYVRTLPDGINSILTKEFTEDGIILSGGQMQKLLLARTFVNDAPIILLDEATSAMDAISENNIYTEIEKYACNKTLIYISHKLSATKNADQIYVFENGRIIESGTHSELMELQGVYEKMFTMQAEKYN